MNREVSFGSDGPTGDGPGNREQRPSTPRVCPGDAGICPSFGISPCREGFCGSVRPGAGPANGLSVAE